MEDKFTYRGRKITLEDINFIRQAIAENPKSSRYFLSRYICRAWNWTQQNGAEKHGVCRGLLLRLESEGYLTLPPRKYFPPNPFVNRKKPFSIAIREDSIKCKLSAIQPICLKQVRRTLDEKLYNALIEQYHYLGYSPLVGENLKYIAFWGDRPIACVGWSSAAWHIGCRDRFIGWPAQVRKNNLHLIAYQSRFLIVPWVSVPYLASHLLSLSVKTISQDWSKIYNHPIYWVETFVDNERGFKGTCYKAANWIYLGNTTGRGKNDKTNKANRSIKMVWGYPLSKSFRQLLQCGAMRSQKVDVL